MAKEPKDILDENVIERLNAEDPTNRDIAEGLKLVIRMLWSEERLREVVREEHRQLCESCEFRTKSDAARGGAAGQDGCALATQDAEPNDRPEPLTRRHVMMAVVKAPWFWLVVATACAAVCAKLGISLPVVGGGS